MDKLLNFLDAKVRKDQDGVPTYIDNYLRNLISKSEKVIDPRAGELITYFSNHSLRKRFVDIYTRKLHHSQISHLIQDDFSFLMSQGLFSPMSWDGHPLYKTAFDFAVITMLVNELKPKTIIEFGSGVGASAAWLKSITQPFCERIITVDIKDIKYKIKGVEYIQADCSNIDNVFNEGLFDNMPHPIFIIEDMHVNTFGFLNFISEKLIEGDYLFIEDSIVPEKRYAIEKFMHSDKGQGFRLDTFYLDFFGFNSTSAKDSIFKVSFQ